jgi:hypothetical protein
MRLFQNAGVYPAYLPRLRQLTADANSFAAQRSAFLADRFGACHLLQPVLEGEPDTFFTNGDDELLQRQWAREQGLREGLPLPEILLAQIEHHRTEVFYNLDPVRYQSDFVRRLPGTVRRKIAWRAAPSPGADFGAYDLVVCNFQSILDGYSMRGWATAWFAPAHDPVMDGYAARQDRPVDVLFVGSYTRHHRRRAELLENVARIHGMRIVFHLDTSRLTRLAESPLGRTLPLGQYRRPSAIKTVSCAPVFGLDLYHALGTAKLVLNGAIDMASADRGNMRCFEAMGCGCLLLSDSGRYPPGMIAGEHFATYDTARDAVRCIIELLARGGHCAPMAQAGHSMLRAQYSKAAQWARFQDLAGAV